MGPAAVGQRRQGNGRRLNHRGIVTRTCGRPDHKTAPSGPPPGGSASGAVGGVACAPRASTGPRAGRPCRSGERDNGALRVVREVFPVRPPTSTRVSVPGTQKAVSKLRDREGQAGVWHGSGGEAKEVPRRYSRSDAAVLGVAGGVAHMACPKVLGEWGREEAGGQVH